MDANRRFCELAGICWHEYDHADIFIKNDKIECIHCHQWLRIRCSGTRYIFVDNIDYGSNPIAVLRVMREKTDFPKFIGSLTIPAKAGPSRMRLGIMIFINDYLLTPSAMRDEAVRFLEGMEADNSRDEEYHDGQIEDDWRERNAD